MNDQQIVEYLRARGRVEPPYDLADSIAEAVSEVPQRRTSPFALWLPAVAAVGAATVIAVVSILLAQEPNIGPSPAPSGSPAPSATDSLSTNLTQPGNVVEMPARDDEGRWGTIRLERGDEFAVEPELSLHDGGSVMIAVHVTYDADRDSSQGLGPSDWSVRVDGVPSGPDQAWPYAAVQADQRHPDERLDSQVTVDEETLVEGWIGLEVAVSADGMPIYLAYHPGGDIATPPAWEVLVRAEAESAPSEPDLVEIGSQVTIDAVDESGPWGSITLTRRPDTAGYPGHTDPGQFLVQVFVEYEPNRLPDPEQFGASDWTLRPTEADAENFFLTETTNARATDEAWPVDEALLGQYPGAVDILTTPISGLIQLPVAVSQANHELELVYGPPVGGGEVVEGVDVGSASVRIRLPGPPPDPLPTPTPAAGEAGYVDQAGLPFSVLDSPEADQLFVDADTCTNRVTGYTVSYPDSWYTNTEIGDVPACSWFTPAFFEVTAAGVTPNEIWISVGTIDSAFGYIGTTEVFSSEELPIGGRLGRRLEYNPDPNGEPDYRGYHYVIELGVSAATGPTFIAQTDNEMAADYVLARAVLDRIMASLRFTD